MRCPKCGCKKCRNAPNVERRALKRWNPRPKINCKVCKKQIRQKPRGAIRKIHKKCRTRKRKRLRCEVIVRDPIWGNKRRCERPIDGLLSKKYCIWHYRYYQKLKKAGPYAPNVGTLKRWNPRKLVGPKEYPYLHPVSIKWEDPYRRYIYVETARQPRIIKGFLIPHTGIELTIWRLKRRLTIQELARIIKVKPSTIKYAERHKIIPWGTIERIVEAIENNRINHTLLIPCNVCVVPTTRRELLNIIEHLQKFHHLTLHDFRQLITDKGKYPFESYIDVGLNARFNKRTKQNLQNLLLDI